MGKSKGVKTAAVEVCFVEAEGGVPALKWIDVEKYGVVGRVVPADDPLVPSRLVCRVGTGPLLMGLVFEGLEGKITGEGNDMVGFGPKRPGGHLFGVCVQIGDLAGDKMGYE